MTAPRSPLSDYSVLSSFDALSLSSPSRRSSAFSQLSYPHSPAQSATTRSSVDYDIIASSAGSSQRSLDSSDDFTQISSVRDEESIAAGASKSQSAKRRERKKKLIAGEKERALAGEESRVLGSSRQPLQELNQMPHTPKPKAKKGAYTVDAAFVTPRPSSLISVQTSAASSGAPANSSDWESSSSQAERPRRKTRRGGKAARRRAEGRQARQVDDELADDRTTSPTSSAATSRSGTPVRVFVERVHTEGGARTRVSVYAEDEDEVDDLSALEDDVETPQSSISLGMGSIMSVEDAVSSIDSFLSDPRNFMTIKANKLRLWQSLCIELGLVHLAGDELPDLPSVVCVPTPPRPRETTPEPAQPWAPTKAPFPRTLTQARKLLQGAHINLVDYLEARKYCPPAYVGAYQGLLYPSVTAMKKYTRYEGKFAQKQLVRAEWLEPLMRDFGIKKVKSV